MPVNVTAVIQLDLSVNSVLSTVLRRGSRNPIKCCGDSRNVVAKYTARP